MVNIHKSQNIDTDLRQHVFELDVMFTETDLVLKLDTPKGHSVISRCLSVLNIITQLHNMGVRSPIRPSKAISVSSRDRTTTTVTLTA